MDQSVTEWLLALSEEYEKKARTSDLQNKIKEELFEVLSHVTQEALSEHLSSQINSHPSINLKNQPQSQNPTQGHTPPPSQQPSHLSPPEALVKTVAQGKTPKKRSDEEILKALLELRNSGQLKRNSSQKSTESLTPILRPSKPSRS
ncbi:hypothetical protein EBS43_00220 [bacterium]|jgi:hypothetical protein|nr:hypothetical protein [bacterium]